MRGSPQVYHSKIIFRFYSKTNVIAGSSDPFLGTSRIGRLRREPRQSSRAALLQTSHCRSATSKTATLAKFAFAIPPCQFS